jgi:hypothetical protein
MGTSELQIVSEEVAEQEPGLHVALILPAIHGDRHAGHRSSGGRKP